MIIEELKRLIESISENRELQLLAVRQTSMGQVAYSAKVVPFSHYDDLSDYARSIVNFCTVGRKAPFTEVDRIRKFDGGKMENRWSCIETTNELLSEAWESFTTEMEHPSREGKLEELSPNALVLTSVQRDFYLIMQQHSILNLKKRKILWGRQEFQRLPDDKILLTLSPSLDVICTNGQIVFISDRGIPFFLGDSAIKKAASRVVARMKDCKWIADFDSFEKGISIPRNALNLLAVSEARLERLNSTALQRRIAKTFGLKYESDKFATTGKADISKLIKVLGKRGLFDIVEEVPVEVSGSDEWK